jgi:small subunit ribosomal protein S18
MVAGASSRPTPAGPPLYVGPMAAKSKRSRDGEPGSRPGRPGGSTAKVFKRKSCLFCKDKTREVDYKNVEQLRRYTSERGKIRSRRMSGACRRHQRQIAVAIKRAREMALLPYVAEGGGPPSSRSRSGERR